ncbi:MAG: TetR/AcrR family transcriptional regulator [Salaquimonas sp.]|nr:TetR/AcrR family transcriptional regulator [Salaquimonas sp.]
MSDETGKETRGSETHDRVARRPRADALRNLDALLQAAKSVFASSGVDAPVREIADKAGVGIGTVYRHFPQRSDLITAVFRREIDACASAAPALAAEHEPGEALGLWIQRYVDFIATKRGLATALHSGDPAYQSLPIYFDSKLQPALRSLLDAAIATDDIRADVEPNELLHAVADLSASGGPAGSDRSRRMVALLVDGLRYGASSNKT